MNAEIMRLNCTTLRMASQSLQYIETGGMNSPHRELNTNPRQMNLEANPPHLDVRALHVAKFKRNRVKFYRMSFNTAARNAARAVIYGSPPSMEPITQSNRVKRPYSANQTYSPGESGYHSLTLNEVSNWAIAPVKPPNRAYNSPNRRCYVPPSGYVIGPTQSSRIFDTRPIASMTSATGPVY